MLAYYLPELSKYVPESIGITKRASLSDDFPVSSRDDALTSALAINLMETKHHRLPDDTVLTKVASAVVMYGVTDDLASLSALLTQRVAAESTPSEEVSFLTKQASFLGDLSGFTDVSALAASAEDLYDTAPDGAALDDAVLRYAGAAYITKQAALSALNARTARSGHPGYEKIASALEGISYLTPSDMDVNRVLCREVSDLDKEAGLHAVGFDFYREALITKVAGFKTGLTVMLAGSQVPYDTIDRIGKDTIGQYLGNDVANEYDSGPENFKQVLETLPLDLQKILLNISKNV